MLKHIVALFAGMLSATTLASTETRLLDCSALTNDNDRLACYDRIAQSLTTPELTTKKNSTTNDASAANTPSVSPQAVQLPQKTSEQIEQGFGLEHKRTEQELNADSFLFTISKVSEGAHGKWTLLFDNYQQWQTLGSNRIKFKVGQQIVIRRGIFNSFNASIKGQNRSVKVKRLK